MKKAVIISVLLGISFAQSLLAAGNFIVKNECQRPIFVDINMSSPDGKWITVKKKVEKNSLSEVIDLERFGNKIEYIMANVKPEYKYKIDFLSGENIQPRVSAKNFISVFCAGDVFTGDYKQNFAGGPFVVKKAFIQTPTGWGPQT